MPGANRHSVLGHAWRITHRCHRKEFLLEFAKDRQARIDWLFEAKKRYGMVILNCLATSNHIHLLIHDRDGGEVIAKSVQLAAGRTVQTYDQRKRRKGTYWEDRYHATAVQNDQHLVQCIRPQVDVEAIPKRVCRTTEGRDLGQYSTFPVSRIARVDDFGGSHFGEIKVPFEAIAIGGPTHSKYNDHDCWR